MRPSSRAVRVPKASKSRDESCINGFVPHRHHAPRLLCDYLSLRVVSLASCGLFVVHFFDRRIERFFSTLTAMSADNLAEAREELEKEFAQVREHLGEIEQAMQALMKCGPEDEISKMLETLEDRVHKARTGGVLGSGANGHAKALKEYLALKVR
jgi:hypothetical protein